MKRMFSFTLIVLVTLVNVKADNELLAMKITGNRSFEISVKNVVGEAQLMINDLEGTMLYNSSIEHKGSYTKTFDVSSLPVGIYIMSIKDEFKTKTVELSIDKTVSIDLDQVKTNLNPIITNFRDKLIVSIYSAEREKLTISIFDENGNPITNHAVKGEGYFGQNFNLEALETGTYKVIVNHKGRTFRKELTI